jgi:putative peptidoglycan lipid II flippase
VPSAVGFIALGDVIAGALLQTGRFTHADSQYVWGILAAASVGLLASTLGRLYSSTFYALRDTRTPLRFAIVRVALTTGLGYACAIPLHWGVPGLTGSAGVAGWVEFALLRRSLQSRIGRAVIPAVLTAKLWASALAAAAAAWGVKLAIGHRHPVLAAIAILTPYGLVYFGATAALGVEECSGLLRRVTRRIRR